MASFGHTFFNARREVRRATSGGRRLLQLRLMVACNNRESFRAPRLPGVHRPSSPGRMQLSRSASDRSSALDATQFCVVNFYHLVDVEQPHEMLEQHRAYMKGKDVRGRIYISEQGVNAQYGGETRDAVGYAEWLKANDAAHFGGLKYSVDPVDTHMFPKLRLQYKPNLISLAGGMAGIPVTDPEARATKVSPKDWREMLANGIDGKKPVVLDVRNAYEWDAGHFEGAERPLEGNFKDTPTDSTDDEVPYYLQGLEEDTSVMMYCTGGIRCDVYSAYLKRKGFNKLYTLEGGIQNYMKQEGLDHWKGSLYVFDGRMAIRPNKDVDEPLVAVANCALCGGEAILPHLNCANVDCNKLFLACQGCQDKHQGCCCEACVDSPRKLRPIKPEGGYGQYRKYTSSDDESHVV
jgi:predicted sulfurtransferase